MGGTPSPLQATTRQSAKGKDEECLLAIDAGTGSCRAILFDLNGKVRAKGQREWHHRSTPGIVGSQVFDAESNWRLICDCIQAALADAPCSRVISVSCSGMGASLVLYNKVGKEIWACSSADSRALDQARAMLESGEAQELYRIGGGWISLSSLPRLRWVKQHQREVFRSIAHLSMTSDWVVHRLVDDFITDPSAGSTSGMFDLRKRKWSSQAIEAADLPESAFPRVVDSGTFIGGVTESASEGTGLAVGTPVVAGGADTALGVFGSGRAGQDLTVTGGSHWKETFVARDALLESKGMLRTTCHVVPGEWVIEGIGFHAGVNLRTFRDTYFKMECLESRKGVTDPYELMESMAFAIPPGSYGRLAMSTLGDAWSWHEEPSNPVSWGDEWEVFRTRGVWVRAIQEAAAYGARASISAMKKMTGVPLSPAVFTGGAARGKLWPKILADVTGADIRIPPASELAALGAAVMAARGVGIDMKIAPPRQAAHEGLITPNPEMHQVYNDLFEVYSGSHYGKNRLSL